MSGFPSTSLCIIRTLKLHRRFATAAGAGLSVFDRNAKKRQRDWASKQKDFVQCQYIKDEIGYRVADRVYDITRFFDVAVDLGAGGGHIAPHIFKENVGHLIQVDISSGMLEVAKKSEEVKTSQVICDEELVPFEPNSIDLFISSLSLHWINDLPSLFHRCFKCLRPDGVFLAAMLGGDTLYELRCSLQLAEMERRGGMTSHLSPFTKASDISALMNGAGFALVTLDTDELVVGYPDPLSLMYDLQVMGESGAAYKRSPHLRKDVLMAASAIYKSMYSKESSYPATYDILYMIGWKPGENMPKTAPRGSGKVSLKDLGEYIENPPNQ